MNNVPACNMKGDWRRPEADYKQMHRQLIQFSSFLCSKCLFTDTQVRLVYFPRRELRSERTTSRYVSNKIHQVV